MLERDIKNDPMKDLPDHQSDELRGGVSACATSIVLSTSIGGLFGGIGAAIGFIGAAAGPACLAIF
jgi:hypothetical protein